MPKFNKPLPEMLNAVWASEALSQNNVYPDVDYVEEGWLQIKPPYEYENAINYKHDQFIAHINQLGVVEWDSETEYQANKSYVQSGNSIYKCIQTHTNKSPSTAGNEAFWELFEGNRQASQSRRGTTRYSTDSEASLGNLSNVSLTPANLRRVIGNFQGGSSNYISIPLFDRGSTNIRNVLIQWLRVDISQGQYTSSFSWPTPFTSEVFTATVSDNSSASSVIHNQGLESLTLVGGVVRTDTLDGDSPYLLAIGV